MHSCRETAKRLWIPKDDEHEKTSDSLQYERVYFDIYLSVTVGHDRCPLHEASVVTDALRSKPLETVGMPTDSLTDIGDRRS